MNMLTFSQSQEKVTELTTTAAKERKAKSEQQKRFPVLAAFDLCLKCSHLFNILDARGAISVTERVGVIARIRNLAVGVAKAYVHQQQAEQEAASTLLRRKMVRRTPTVGGEPVVNQQPAVGNWSRPIGPV